MADKSKRYSGRNSLISFLISLFVGTIAIYTGAWIVFGSASLSTALIAALVGAIVWGLTSFFLGWIPLLGSVLTLLAWLGAINWMYSGGLIVAAQIAVFAWIVSLLATYLISKAGIAEIYSLGVPGD